MMKLYVIHHSHTDIGYTDLQEKIIYTHIDYIRQAVKTICSGEKDGFYGKYFKWNCETAFCVEQFLKEVSEEEKQAFFNAVKSGNIGISAGYLNFTDLVDMDVLDKRTAQLKAVFTRQGISVNTAMTADVNGVPLGMLNMFLKNGIEFFYMNIHCHHGMYPLYKNQCPFFWENNSGMRLLVWNGEHYNLGNVLGLAYNKAADCMPSDSSDGNDIENAIENIKTKTDAYIKTCLDNGYRYDFIPVSVSGVFSDNAPPNSDIAVVIDAFNKRYGNEVCFEMVTLQQLYEKIKDKVSDAPVYKGDLTDWWAHGVGSIPDALKHYKEAQRVYALCTKLDPENTVCGNTYMREAEDNMLLFAEHTYGHSAAVTDPYDTAVRNLDIRNVAYASKAYEAAEKNLIRILHAKGDILRYYNRAGRMKAVNVSPFPVTLPVKFYIAAYGIQNIEVIDESTGKAVEAQVSAHPRGALITFVADFKSGEEKTYRYKQIPAKEQKVNSGIAYMGAERVRDIVNDYDPLSYTLPFYIESDYFRIEYEIGKGVTSFYDKKDKREMLAEGDARFFTPIYENTEIRTNVYEERRLLGRNIRAAHAKRYHAVLTDVRIAETGDVFKTVELVYMMEGTLFGSVVICLYNHIPRIEFAYKIAKKVSFAVENVFLPLTLNTGHSAVYFDKGNEVFKPGIEQIPGSCMEYYLVDNGLIYAGDKSAVFIQQLDTALIYMGELKYHPITLCDNDPKNNLRDMYSWIMNNIWETNFRLDLSGINEYRYILTKAKADTPEKQCMRMKAYGTGIISFIIE